MAFDLAALIREGYRFELQGPGVSVRSPEGRYGHGASEEEAVLNIDSQIIPVVRDDYVGRLLIRADGSEVQMDALGARGSDAN